MYSKEVKSKQEKKGRFSSKGRWGVIFVACSSCEVYNEILEDAEELFAFYSISSLTLPQF